MFKMLCPVREHHFLVSNVERERRCLLQITLGGQQPVMNLREPGVFEQRQLAGVTDIIVYRRLNHVEVVRHQLVRFFKISKVSLDI